jgi:hypothetical protein
MVKPQDAPDGPRWGQHCVVAVVLALVASTQAAAQGGGARPGAGCPDLTGHYRVAGSGTALADALKALGGGSAGGEVRLSGGAEQGLSVWAAQRGGAMAQVRNGVLHHGTDFRCEHGWIEFIRPVPTSRKTDQGWHEGPAIVRLGRSGPRGLVAEVRFSGGQRTTIYSYDSARISVPQPGTRIRMSESFRWPDLAEPEAPAATVPAIEPEPRQVAQARLLLDARMLRTVTLGGLRLRGEAVVASLNAPRTDDVAKLEDRLRAAAVAYKMDRPPTWTGAGYYVELVLWPPGAQSAASARPSAFRVQQEIMKSRHPMFEVKKVQDAGDGYVVTLSFAEREKLEAFVARLKANSPMIADIAVLSESGTGAVPGQRIAQLKVQVR